MKLLHALASGLAGSLALTLLHEGARRAFPEAPRMDLLGREVLARSLQGLGRQVPPTSQLQRLALAGDLAGNALYYSLVGAGQDSRQAWLRGGLLGALAGVGALVLPSPLGLATGPSNRSRPTRLLTVALYTLGGLAAAGVFRAIRIRQS